METNDLITFLGTAKTEEELILMCKAAVKDLGEEGFMEAILPATKDALDWYEDKIDQLMLAYDTMAQSPVLAERTTRVSVMAGTIVDMGAALDQMDLATVIAILMERLYEAGKASDTD